MKPSFLLCAAGVIIMLNGCATMDKLLGRESSDVEKKEQQSIQATSEGKKAVSGAASGKHSNFSGYLVRYDDMKEVATASGGTALRWVSPDLKKGQYSAIMIDPVGFYPKPPLLAKVSKGRMLEAVQYLRQQAQQVIGQHLKIVDKPGPGVLHWDAAVTGVKAGPEQRVDATHLAAAMIFTDASPTALPQHYGYVVFLESRLVDSQSKKLVAKSVRAGVGNKVADPSKKILIEDIKPVLDGWVQDAGTFVITHVK
ncbi:MAG: DUF3313 domain-containing protein [Planctomycetes bacterium]|nr:DUF3313 domain-containing protein [Planctomycetota bacterium]